MGLIISVDIGAKVTMSGAQAQVYMRLTMADEYNASMTVRAGPSARKGQEVMNRKPR